MSKFVIVILSALVLGCSNNPPEDESLSPKQMNLVEIAKADRDDRITYDVTGNVIEVDLRGLDVSDQSFDHWGSERPQVLKLSGAMITAKVLHYIEDTGLSLSRLVLEDTQIADDDVWLKQFKDKHPSTVIELVKVSE